MGRPVNTVLLSPQSGPCPPLAVPALLPSATGASRMYSVDAGELGLLRLHGGEKINVFLFLSPWSQVFSL